MEEREAKVRIDCAGERIALIAPWGEREDCLDCAVEREDCYCARGERGLLLRPWREDCYWIASRNRLAKGKMVFGLCPGRANFMSKWSTPMTLYERHFIKFPLVLLVPYPAQGHINPMIQFRKRLLSHGINSTIAITLHLSKTITPTSSSPIVFETISDGCDRAGFNEAGTDDIYLDKLRHNGSRTLAELIIKLNSTGRPVDVLIYDGFLPWALDVGKRFGLLGVLFFTQTCSVNAIYYHVHKGNLKLPLTQSTVSLPGLPLLQDSETPSFVHLYGNYPGFSHTVVNQFSNIDKADWVLFNSFYDMEKEVLDWARNLWRVRTIGPTLPSVYLDNRLKDDTDYEINLFNPDSSSCCMNWLNSKPSYSVVYVSFGSMADLSHAQIAEIASGLQDTNHFFIWVVRSSESIKLPENFKPEKGLVVSWCPQLEVLANKSIGCFVTHCGFNSVIEAMCLGVGMVAVPQWSDQVTNGKFVEQVWGIGIRAKKDGNGIVRREELRDCIWEVMDGERCKGREIAENLLKWKRLGKEAIDEGVLQKHYQSASIIIYIFQLIAI